MIEDNTRFQSVPVQQEPVQQEPVQQEPVQQEPVQQEPVQQEPVQQEPIKKDRGNTSKGLAILITIFIMLVFIFVFCAIDETNAKKDACEVYNMNLSNNQGHCLIENKALPVLFECKGLPIINKECEVKFIIMSTLGV